MSAIRVTGMTSIMLGFAAILTCGVPYPVIEYPAEVRYDA